MFESPQVNFYVQDVEVSARLYRASCGFTETFRTPEHGKRTTPTMPEQAGAGDRAAPWLQMGTSTSPDSATWAWVDSMLAIRNPVAHHACT